MSQAIVPQSAIDVVIQSRDAVAGERTRDRFKWWDHTPTMTQKTKIFTYRARYSSEKNEAHQLPCRKKGATPGSIPTNRGINDQYIQAVVTYFRK